MNEIIYLILIVNQNLQKFHFIFVFVSLVDISEGVTAGVNMADQYGAPIEDQEKVTHSCIIIAGCRLNIYWNTHIYCYNS